MLFRSEGGAGRGAEFLRVLGGGGGGGGGARGKLVAWGGEEDAGHGWREGEGDVIRRCRVLEGRTKKESEEGGRRGEGGRGKEEKEMGVASAVDLEA